MMRANDRQDGPPKTGISKDQKDLIARELEAVLDSSAFRGSKRGQQFLRYAVEQALAGNFDVLKERSLGAELFGREPSYDTGDDAIVRVAAKEVRNRLNHYYSGLSSPPEVRIDVAPGSYIPEFHWGSRPVVVELPRAAAPQTVSARRSTRLYAGIALGAVLVAGLAWFAFARQTPRSGDTVGRFWAPVLESPRPVLICLANPVVYRLDDGVVGRFGSSGRPDSSLRIATIPPNAVLYGREVIPEVDGYVGVGDSMAASALAMLFTRSSKSSQVRASKDMSFADLRTSPSVLIGAFTNEWTLEMMRDWRFVFDLPGGYVIRDRSAAGKTWAAKGLREHKVTEDHALISRVFDPRSGQPVISVAGITQFGTEAGAEFLCDQSLLAAAFRNAPRDWDRKNLQIIVKTSVIRHTPGSPEFVASHFW